MNLFKGDYMSFSKWLPGKFGFAYSISKTTYYVGLWHELYTSSLYQYIYVFERKLVPTLREMILAPVRKWNSFNKYRKDGKFGIHLVDSMRNTLLTLELVNVSVIYFHMKIFPYPLKSKYYLMIYV